MKKNIYLTNPAKGVSNNGCDNVDKDLIVREGDILTKTSTKAYKVVCAIGNGTYGQVFRCIDIQKGTLVAVKVIKNTPAYFAHGMMEVTILNRILMDNYIEHLIEMKDNFIYKNHLCIVQECLGINLFEFIKDNNFVGFDHAIVKRILSQILAGLEALNKMGITHCDIKPENILLVNNETLKIKIIDFSSAVYQHGQKHFYIQSRYYRAPEVLLEFSFSSSIDIWSLGCIAYELFVGYPLFPGKNSEDQMYKIFSLLGAPPTFMMECSRIGKTLKNVNFEDQFEMRMDKFKHLIFSKSKNNILNELFLDFLLSILVINPFKRKSLYDSLKHPYFAVSSEIETEQATNSSKDVEEYIRNQPNPNPQEIVGYRRRTVHSMSNMCDGVKKEGRKKSVFDIKENLDEENG
ncbi:putative dual specificity protein kinase YAK1 like protein [Astathelohania contejeani]|uniref:Dual specificity protein kinase YAK1 like protein n=1 Tax=Astathelohania contejeani TaxID=164912 RepID=A0ABQ7HYS8_9MICR|nr:putative dual specificity protein kinase YAK1 like protein [Thelohania contejeani]